MKNLNTLVKSMLNNFGYDIHKINSSSDPAINLKKGLQKNNIDLVLDIGGNIGQFGKWLVDDLSYKGKIISFEPITTVHNELTSVSSNYDNWVIHERCAIGDVDGETIINISKNLVSSSLLPINKAHTNIESNSKYISSEKTPIFKIDSLAKQIDIDGYNSLLKIDTQGFEKEVLDGASKSLSSFKGIICELSTATLYDGQSLWVDVISQIEDAGFELWSIGNGFTDHKTGKALQLDSVFFRKE